MVYTINQLYDYLYQKVNSVYDVFKDFFGEGNVDLQRNIFEDIFKRRLGITLSNFGYKVLESAENGFDIPYEISDAQIAEIEHEYSDRKSIIYVHWNNVTVTNEHDKSVEIQDLYAKVDVQMDGRIPYENVGFLLNRATYTREQFLSNYLFSHIQYIPKSDFRQFLPPCLGRGPIKETIATLKNEYDEVTWMLFCQELSMYVTVESLAGVPWKYLEEIGNTDKLLSHTDYTTDASKLLFLSLFSADKLKEFIKYYLEHGHLSLSFVNNKFTSGLPYYEYIIDVSNSFIDFYNKYLKLDERQLKSCYDKGLLYKSLVKNGKFYKNAEDQARVQNLDNYQNKPVLTFKGRMITTTIIDTDFTEATLTTIINNSFAMYVLDHILRTINFRYRNEYNKESREADITSTYQRVCYI